LPSWVQLQYAIAVEKHRHFGKASKSCHVSQPTLSQQLQKLEDEVGIILFDRTKKPILATPEGKRFLEQARNVLREQEKLLHVARQSRSGTLSGEFRLGIIPTVASELLPLFLKSFSKAFPEVDLYIEEMKTESILHELSADRLDGAILATPISDVDLKIHPLYYEAFYAYFSAGHPLTARAEIARTDLELEEMWLLQDGHCFKDQVLNYCVLPGKSGSALSNIHFQSGSLNTLRRLVQNGRGYTLIPALMALSLRKQERDAHVRPFKSPVPTREISLIYRRDHWKLAIIRAIEEWVTRSLPSEIPRSPAKGMKVLEVCDVPNRL
jgi:LysR family transcriptional regulator, hydrogen peroxide-inducible genes activator